MNNYIIEDNIDFYAELEKELHKENNVNNNSKVCLLTKNELSNFNIKLSCGHSFNYIPLYNEIKVQKNKNINYKDIIRLRKNEFKCPYCRNVEKNLIPYVDFEGVEKIVGVNSSKKLTYNYFPCDYVLKSGKQKGNKCCSFVYNNTNCIDGKYYCKKHIKSIRKNMIKDTNNLIKCSAILKTGKRKGQHCNCSKIYNENLCKRHYNAKYK